LSRFDFGEVLQNRFLPPLRTCRRIQTDALVNHAEVDEPIFFRVTNNTDRFQALLYTFDLLAEQFSQLDDAFIARAEVCPYTAGRHSAARRYVYSVCREIP